MSTKRKAIKFKRMADALLDSGGSSSSGSEHFPSGSLYDMVNSFLQRSDGNPSHDENDCVDDVESDDSDDCSSSSKIEERKRLLMKLLGQGDDETDSIMKSRRKIIREIETSGFNAQIGNNCVDSGFNRRLMAHLRQTGYNAGLCKSRWEKTGRYPGGTYEYIDVINSSDPFSRDIIEILPARQFEIARPTEAYTSLLEGFPHVFVGSPEKLKQVARLMSAAMKESLKSNALSVAPWRRNGYLTAQWFAPYKRTINVMPTRPVHVSAVGKPEGKIRRIVVGFVEDVNLPDTEGGVVYNCGQEFSSKGGKRNGLLAVAFQGKLVEATSSGSA